MLFGIVRFFGVWCRFFFAKQILLLKRPEKGKVVRFLRVKNLTVWRKKTF